MKLSFILAVVMLATSLAAQGQTTIHRIAYVRAEPPPSSYLEAFRQGLREHGYVEGKNAVIEVRSAGGNEEKLRSHIRELIALKTDVIVASAPAATRAAMDVTSTIPIVMVTVADPVNFGFVKSLARPGANVTGFAFLLPELSGKRLQLLKEAVPRLSRVAVVWNASNPYKAHDLKEVQIVADALKVEILSLPVHTSAEFAEAFDAAAQKGAGGLITLEDPFTITHRAQIVTLAHQHKLPAVYGHNAYSEIAGLMSYGPDPLDQNRRAGAVVDRIIKGTKPAVIPVERPVKFELFINVKTAKAIGLNPPQSILLRADRIIE